LLSTKQVKFLRSLAHHLSPLVQVGKAGVTATLLDQVDIQLESHELIKISVLESSPMSRDDVGEVIVEQSGAHLVQTIGKIVVLYRESEKQPSIVLPRA